MRKFTTIDSLRPSALGRNKGVMIDWSCVCSYLDELDRNKGRNVHDESDAGTRNTFAGCPFPHREEYLEDCRLGGASLKCTVYCIMQHACNG